MFLQRYEEHGEAFLRRIFTGDRLGSATTPQRAQLNRVGVVG